jgi:hypothetical protein
MNWQTNRKASAEGKAIALGTKGKGEVPAHLVGKVAFLQSEPESEESNDKPLTKDDIIAELKALEVQFDSKANKDVLAALLDEALKA